MAAWYTEVDSTQKHRFLAEKKSLAGNTYVYLKGVANTAAGSAVAYDENGVTALVDTDTAATILGPMAVAVSAVDAATKYGWYGIIGSFTVAAGDVADNSQAFATSTAGRLDDAAASIGKVYGAVFRSTDNSTANTATIQLNRPNMAADLST